MSDKCNIYHAERVLTNELIVKHLGPDFPITPFSLDHGKRSFVWRVVANLGLRSNHIRLEATFAQWLFQGLLGF